MHHSSRVYVLESSLAESWSTNLMNKHGVQEAYQYLVEKVLYELFLQWS